ncbi:MAG: hypothetical protein ACRCSG_09215 [Cellulosilyticaceae bacterium]
MSRSKFMVVKLSDLKVPFFILVLVIAAFSIFMLKNNDAEATFAGENNYKDGLYIANLAFADADLDVVVNVADQKIIDVALSDFDETEQTLYKDLADSIDFINAYVTNTQSIELPTDIELTASTGILMDAVSIALSEQADATLKTSYQLPILEELTADSEVSTEDAANVDGDLADDVTIDMNDDVSADASVDGE